MKYKIVSGESISELEDQVNNLLANGWLLFGGVAVSNWCFRSRDDGIEVRSEYCQAMTLESEEKRS